MFPVCFSQRKADKEITIELTPNSASDTPYPKAFNVTLFNLSTDARLHGKYSKTMVIISSAAQTTRFLKLRSDSLKTPLSNDDMTRIMQSLYSTLNQDSLQASHVTITSNFLNTILNDLGDRADEKDRVLTSELSNLFMNVFDVLLDPERADFKGKSQFTEPFVKYAFALLYGEDCPGSLVVKKKGKYATVEGRRRYEKDINKLKIKSRYFILFIVTSVLSQLCFSHLLGNVCQTTLPSFLHLLEFFCHIKSYDLSISSIISLTSFPHLFLLYCPYHLNLASLIFSAMSTTSHLLISSFRNISDQLTFISSYYMSISSQPCFHHLLCNVYYLASSDFFIP